MLLNENKTQSSTDGQSIEQRGFHLGRGKADQLLTMQEYLPLLEGSREFANPV